MYSKLPNLILGFHGCDQEIADAILCGGAEVKPSTNSYDWLGHGAYFWEQNLNRAQAWAVERQQQGKIKNPAVVGAVVDLGHCLNLMDSENIDLLAHEYGLLKESLESVGEPLPEYVGSTPDKLLRNLDGAVIQHLHTRLEREKRDNVDTLEPFDSVRALFAEGPEIYPGAGFRKKTHVQICVRNPNCIKGYFDPRMPVRNWPIP